MYTDVQKIYKTGQGAHAYAGEPPDKGVDAEQHNCPDYILRKGLSNAAGVACKEVFLEFFAFVRGII